MPKRSTKPAITDSYDRYLWGVLLFVVVLSATMWILMHLQLFG